MSAIARIEGRQLHTKQTAMPYADDEPIIRAERSIRGSRRLRDAILRAKGYIPPRTIAPPTPLPAPIFKPRKCKKGRPKGNRKVRRVYPRIEQIKALIAAHFDITVEALLSPRRDYEVCHPRQAAMYLSRKSTTASWPDIGLLFGGRDHTTVIHAVRQIEKRIAVGHAETIMALNAVHKVIGA